MENKLRRLPITDNRINAVIGYVNMDTLEVCDTNNNLLFKLESDKITFKAIIDKVLQLKFKVC